MQDVAARFREFSRLDRNRSEGGLDRAELERWVLLKRFLGKAFAPGLSDSRADQRHSVRVPTRLKVSFHSVGELRGSLMTNLSRGGLFIATDRPADLGSRLELRIHIEDTGEDIVLPAVVVSHDVGPDLRPEPRGMGMRFLELSPEMQRRVDVLYDRELEKAIAEEG